MGLEVIRNSKEDGVKWEAPLKAYLEEKLWWALFWMKPLEVWWRKELGEGYFKELKGTGAQGLAVATDGPSAGRSPA